MDNAPIIIDGKKVASSIYQEISQDLTMLKEFNIVPGLAVVQVGNDPSSTIYVNNKVKAAESLGMHSFVYNLDEHCTTKHLAVKIEHLNNDPKINGILVQLPLPEHVDPIEIINTISPSKDVDGLTVENVGKLVTNQDCLVPCTPQGCLHLIKSITQDLSGLRAVVIGRSNIVGRPMANLLINENCTVTTIHSHSKNIKDICKEADILVVAAGSPRLVDESWVKEDAIVIDVGITRSNNSKKLNGDVNFDSVKNKARAITPVPGGVGPMTIACLLKNTLKATLEQRGLIKKDGIIVKKLLSESHPNQ